MPVATRRELTEAGVHFGHQTRRWNPKMERFIFGERSGIYIIDLEKTLDGLHEAHDFLIDVGRTNGIVLFVGTKKQAQETVAEQAGRVGMPFVNHRWLGGMLTNFQTMHGRQKRLRELRDMERSGAFEFLPKKEVLRLRHEKEKLERNLAGIQDMERLPQAVFVIDTKKEHIAIKEARKLGIPVVAIVDTNCDPDEVDFVIPGNDDAIRACALVTRVVADALQEGQYLAYQGMQARGAEPEFEPEPGAVTFGPEDGELRRTRLSDDEAAWMGEAVGEGGTATGEEGEAAAEPVGEPAPASSTEEPASEPASTEQAAEPEAAPAEDSDAVEVAAEPTEPEPVPADSSATDGAEPDSGADARTAEDAAVAEEPAAEEPAAEEP